MADQTQFSWQLRAIAGNLDSTCLIKVRQPDGKYTYGSGVVVEDGFILTNGRMFESAEQASRSEAIFFLNVQNKKTTGLRVKLAPEILFIRNVPAESKDSNGKTKSSLDMDHLDFCAIAYGETINESNDVIDVADMTPRMREISSDSDSEEHKEELVQDDDDELVRNRSRPPRRRRRPKPAKQRLLTLQDVTPVKIHLADPEKSAQLAQPRASDQVIVIEHTAVDYPAKEYHVDEIQDVYQTHFRYTIERRPAVDDVAIGSPVFNSRGELIGIFESVGTKTKPNRVTRISAITAALRREVRKYRKQGSKHSSAHEYDQAIECYRLAAVLVPHPEGCSELVMEGLRLIKSGFESKMLMKHMSKEQSEAFFENSTTKKYGQVKKDLLKYIMSTSVHTYTDAIETDSRYVDAYVNRGLALAAQDELDAAVDDFSACIQYNPDDADALYYRGRCLHRQGQFTQAIADYTNAIQLDSEDVTFYQRRGDAFSQVNNLEAAKKDYTTAIRLQPEDISSYYKRAGLLKQEGRLGAAIKDYNQVLKLDPNHANALYSRGLAFLLKVKDDWRKAASLKGAQDLFTEKVEEVEAVLIGSEIEDAEDTSL